MESKNQNPDNPIEDSQGSPTRYLKELLDNYDSFSSSSEACDSPPNKEDCSPTFTGLSEISETSQHTYTYGKQATSNKTLKHVNLDSYDKRPSNPRKVSEPISDFNKKEFQTSNSFSKKHDNRNFFSGKSIGGPTGFFRMMKCKTEKAKKPTEDSSRKNKTSSLKAESLDYIVLNINKVLSVQNTSRKLQTRLQSLSPEVIGQLVANIDFQIHMNSKYGNYFCQELIKFCSDEQINIIVNKVSPHVVEIAQSAVGTHSLQKLIERIRYDNQPAFVFAIKDKLVELALHNWGTHVVQKLISIFKSKHLVACFQLLESDFEALVLNKHGVCVAKQMLFMIKDKDLIRKVKRNLEKKGFEIISNEYGNYFVQEMLVRWPDQVADSIEEIVLSNLCELSMQKYASNVVAMVVDMGTKHFIEKSLSVAFSDDNFSKLLKSNFALFVLKSLVKKLDSSDKLNELKLFLQESRKSLAEKEKEKVDQLLGLVLKLRF